MDQVLNFVPCQKVYGAYHTVDLYGDLQEETMTN